MTILNVGILALVAAFQSGALALQRASKLSTAAAIADLQMERYRGYKYCGILFTTSDVTSAQGDSTYTADVAYANAQLTPSIDPLCSSATPPSDSKPIQSITGPDGKRYRVDTYIIMDSVNAARPLKRVTVVIRNANSLTRAAVRAHRVDVRRGDGKLDGDLRLHARSTRRGSSRRARSTRPTSNAAREQLRVRGLLAERARRSCRAERRGRASRTVVQEDQAEVAPDLLAPVRDDDRGRPQRRRRARRSSRSRPTTSTSRQVIAELRADVEGGLLLSQAMARHPKVFNRLYVAMVEAGEAAGILDQVLDRVAFQIEKETQIKRRVKGAMIYPTMVLIFATLVLIGMLMFLVPIFVKIFAQLGGELPTLTQYVVTRLEPAARATGSSSSRRSVGSIVGFRRWKKTRAAAGSAGTAFKLQGADEDRRQSSSRSRWRASRARSRRSSPPASTSSRRSRSPARPPATGSSRTRSRDVRERVHEGVPIAQPLIENPVFPPMVAQMVKIGEETGELEKMLGKIADFYEDEVDAVDPVADLDHRAADDDRRRPDGRRDHHLDVPADVQDAHAHQVARARAAQLSTLMSVLSTRAFPAASQTRMLIR